MAFHSKKLKNDVVTEFIKGLCETYPGLQYLDGFPDVKVVLRADLSGVKHDKVAVISGGGSGHEPAHAGFVGVGMLTAAICGDVLASPSVDSILAGIRAVTGPSGCLLIVKNYTRDCLNFRLAAEQAKSEGYKVEMVIVGDDCALPPPGGIAERRGLAGTILVQKIAGAAAASGLSLEEVAAEAKQASDRIGTMGVALSVCTLPGQVTPDRLGSGKMELGLGIDGEPGAAVADLQPVDIVVSHVLKRILSTETNYVPITRGSRVVLMINGLGATTYMELMIAAGKAVPELQLEHGLAVERVYTGSFMTSLDTAGFSITVMKADQAILNRLDAPTRAPNWPVAGDGNHPSTKIPVPVPPSRSKTSIETFSRPEQLSPLGHILEEAVVKIPMTVVVLGDSDAGKSTLSGQIIKLTNQKTTPAAQYENLIQTEYDYKRWFGKYNAELKWKPYILAGLRDRKMARELDYLDTEILDYHTQEVGRAYFETEEKKITILDPPGLKIRRSNLISAISEADMGLLVISAPYNEISDQIREQILLARAFQITNLLVVLNKQDHSSL